jgi:hypothetical protein
MRTSEEMKGLNQKRQLASAFSMSEEGHRPGLFSLHKVLLAGSCEGLFGCKDVGSQVNDTLEQLTTPSSEKSYSTPHMNLSTLQQLWRKAQFVFSGDSARGLVRSIFRI